MERFDVVILGAGIIGLSVAKALKFRQPSLKILICEKETSVGLHASSRNSGVLHAGFYYSPESLKAKFCRDENFLWSPTTAVSDPRSVLDALVEELKTNGVEVRCSSHLTNFANRKAILNGVQISYKHLVNCAGSQADRIAHQFDVGKDFSMLPFMGMYRYVEQIKLPLRTLVYPVPHILNPFLGVHFTLTFDNLVKIGPTAIPVLGREQYRLKSKLELSDLKSTLLSSLALGRGSHHSLAEIARSEFPKYSTKFLIRESSKLVPTVSKVSGWKVKPPGIRSQLVNLQSGELVQDFLVEKGPDSTHILNAVSPGWTSALPFGDYVALNVLEDI